MNAYLDNAATAISYPIDTFPFTKRFIGNPSSLHPIGLGAKQLLDDAKDILCSAFGGKRYNYIFTSGATESANIALQGIAQNYLERKILRNEIIISQIEHPAIYETAHYLEKLGFKLIIAPVNSLGFVESNKVKSLLNEKTAMVCIMAINNETGVVQPIKNIFKTVKEFNPKIITVCDTVQAIAKGFEIPLSLTDIFFGSGHKFGGLNGAGFLYFNERVFLKPVIYGGGQQNGIRCGTENTLAISCMAYALQTELTSNHRDKVRSLAALLVNTLTEKGIPFTVNGMGANKSDYIHSIHFKNINSSEAFSYLNSKNVCVSKGSACSSSDVKQSRVLTAMGLNHKEISETLRISLSPFNTKEEIIYFCDCMESFVKRVQ